MNVTDVHIITQDFGTDPSLNYMFEVLIETAEHFRIECNEDLKRSLEDDLRNKLEDLIFRFETKTEKLRNALATLR